MNRTSIKILTVSRSTVELWRQTRKQEIRTLESILLLSLQLNPYYQLWKFPFFLLARTHHWEGHRVSSLLPSRSNAEAGVVLRGKAFLSFGSQLPPPAPPPFFFIAPKGVRTHAGSTARQLKNKNPSWKIIWYGVLLNFMNPVQVPLTCRGIIKFNE